MPTDKQRAASRANSQKSTGPRSAAGKAASRFNALKHGIYAVHQIMFDEKPEDLAELAAEYHELYSPADAKQRFLVDTLVANEWRLRRMRRVEAELWQSASDLFIVKNLDTTVTCTSGDAFATDSATFERLQRLVNSCERVYHRALKELAQRNHGLPVSPTETQPEPAAPQAQPAAEPAPPSQPEQSKPTSTSSASFRYNSQTPPAAPKPAPATPLATPDAPVNPAKAQPSAANRDANTPEAE
jgi:hypothetical protein